MTDSQQQDANPTVPCYRLAHSSMEVDGTRVAQMPEVDKGRCVPLSYLHPDPTEQTVRLHTNQFSIGSSFPSPMARRTHTHTHTGTHARTCTHTHTHTHMHMTQYMYGRLPQGCSRVEQKAANTHTHTSSNIQGNGKKNAQNFSLHLSV